MLKVFEAFSGVGAQRMALRNLGKEYRIVATSEIDSNAILSYYYIHESGFINEKAIEKIERKDMIEYLNKKGIDNEKKNLRLDNIQLTKLFNASVSNKNLGDISKIKVTDIPEHNVFTYSFPCQDISSIGTRQGFKQNSGTRSSLLWECKRIIENKKPKYLILENVKNLVVGKNKNYFLEWLHYLETQGYQNFWKIFDAQDYGIPQRRARVIVVSKLGKSKINLVKDNPYTVTTINNIIDYRNQNWISFVPKGQVKGEVKEGECLFLDDRDWKMNGVMIKNVCSTQRAGRSGLKWIKKKNNNLYERKLTALECCRLMGFKDDDYNKMKEGKLADTTVMKLCGNSIVVNVLENIFQNIYEEELND